MPSTVERPPAANVVGHATEYPSDRERREREHKDRHGIESSVQRPDDQPDDRIEEQDTPAVVIEPHHLQDHTLDGVAAYRATAKTLLVPGYTPGERHPLYQEPGRTSAETVRHAYEDHKDDEEHHAVNVAT